MNLRNKESIWLSILVISVTLDEIIHLFDEGPRLGQVGRVDVLVVAVIVCSWKKKHFYIGYNINSDLSLKYDGDNFQLKFTWKEQK